MKDPKYDTSLYNHKPISDGSKPLISNADYNLLHLQVSSGNYAPYYEAIKKYFIEPKQGKILLDIIENRII